MTALYGPGALTVVHRQDSPSARMHLGPRVLAALGVGAVYTGLELAADPGLTIYVYTAEPGSKSEESLNLLASWAATHELGDAAASDLQSPLRGKRA